MTMKILTTSVFALAMIAMFSVPAAIAQDEAPRVQDTIIVTGSFIRKANQSDQVSPMSSYESSYLDDIAAFNPVDLVNTLTTNSGAQNNADGFNQSNSIGTTNVNLRGLGVSSTLVLLNGRRQTQSASSTLNGDQFVDLNSLVPAIAVGRVEILEDGAASLYGSDAVAGVVNFLTRESFTGLELSGNFIGTTQNSQNDWQASLLWGGEWSDTHLIAAFSFFDRTKLSAAERREEFELRSALSVFGQPGTFLPLAGPGAFVRVPDPACAARAATDPAVVGVIPGGPIAGTCQFDFGDFFSLVAAERRYQGYSKLTHDFAGAKIEIDGGFAFNAIEATATPSQPILFPPVIPPTNPGNITGVPALFFGRVLGAGADPYTNTYNSSTWRISAAASGDINDLWSWEIGMVRAQNTYDTRRGDTNVSRFLAAIAGNGGPNNDKFFNPLFGAENDPAVLDDILDPFTSDSTADLLTIDAHVTGELLDLPGGPVGFAFGGQYRKDELSTDFGDNVNNANLFFNRKADDFSGELNVLAVFGEVSIPLLEKFEISGALRYETFGDDINTVNPKIGFLYRPLDSLSVRGTYGTSFRAPSVFQLQGILSVPARIFDPAITDFATISSTTVSDPDNPVRPQNSQAFNIGLTFQPAESGLSLSVDYWRFEYDNFITPENATAVVAADPSGSQVFRDPTTNTLLSVTTFFRNAGQLDTDGIDIGVSYGFEFAQLGDFVISLDATRVMSYDLKDPIAGSIRGVGRRNFTNFGVPTPEFRGNLGFGWQNGAHSANAFARYIGEYIDENNSDAKIDANVVIDLQYNLDLSSVIGLADNETVLTIGARNILNQMPPDVASRTGFDALTHNPIGRQVYVGVRIGL